MSHKFVFCIECEEWVERFVLPVWGEVHQIDIPVYNDRGEVEGSDKELCYFEGGFSYSKPPEFDPEWNLHVGELEVEVLEPESELYFDMSLPEEYIASAMYHKGLGV
jgi:hypothetical protein